MFGNVEAETGFGLEAAAELGGPYSATKGSGRPAPGTDFA